MALHLVFISLLPLSLASPCNSTCGDLTISPPFGIADPSCYNHDKWFEIECKQHSDGTLKPYLKFIQLEVTKFDHNSCKVWVNSPIYSPNCRRGGRLVNISGGPFVYSREDNAFLGVGCNTQARLLNASSDVFGGCVSICHNLNHSQIRACLGHYCCATSLPQSLSEFNPAIEHVAAANSTGGDDEGCNYAFIAEDEGRNDWGGRILSELKDLDSVPAVLEYYTSCSESDITSTNSSALGPVFTSPCGSAGGRGNSAESKSQGRKWLQSIFMFIPTRETFF